MKDTDIIDSHPGNISLAGRPDSLKNSLVGNFKYVGVPRPMYSGTSPEPAYTNTSSVDFESPAYGFAQVSDEHSNYDSFLISGWYKVNDFSSGHGVFQIDSSSVVGNIHVHTWLRTNNPTSVHFQLGNEDSSGTFQRGVIYGSVNLDTLGWNHMVQIWTGTKVRVYLNGAFNAEKSNGYTDEWSSGTTAQMKFRLAYGRDGTTDVTVDEFSFSEPGAGLTDVEYDTMVSDIYNGGTPTDLGVGGLNINPVHWWRMGDIDPTLFTAGQDWVTSIPNQGSDSTALNINTDMGQPSDATVSSDVPEAPPPPPPPLPPIGNEYSVSFDGTDDYVDTGNKFDFIQQTLNFTISAWIKFENYTTRRNQYILHTTDSGDRIGFMLWFDNRQSGNLLRSRLMATGNSYAQAYHAIRDNNWHHVAVTCSQGGSIRLYVDGSELNSSTAPNTTTATAMHNFIIGGALSTSGQPVGSFEGNLDEVAIFNTDLSSAPSGGRIADIYNRGVPNDISSLRPVGWWRMGDNNSGTGDTITDQSVEGGVNNASLVSGPTFSTDIP